jgi:3-hydroxyisobutyrate dehydrogenase-like beta-hydroxyacid dehydrogenase
MKAAFVGLGVMGYPMAGHLVRHLGGLAVFNRSPDKSLRWTHEHQGPSTSTMTGVLQDVVSGKELLILCVGNDDDVRSLLTGPHGILQYLAPGAVVVDHSTVSADVSREMHAAALACGRHFIDAPVSGGQQGAINGKLTVMCGGDDAAFQRVEPAIRSYAREVRLMGPSGAGQLTKMVNQICIAGLIQSLSEALNFARKAGLDGDQVVQVLSKGAGQSWQMENRYRTMLDGHFEHGFAVDLMRKDLGICFDEARRNGAALPVAGLVDQFYALVQQLGGGRWDTSSLITLLTSGDDKP